jgi:hypothetical protein
MSLTAPEVKEKECKKCKKVKPIAEFALDQKLKAGRRRASCKTCCTAQAMESYKKKQAKKQAEREQIHEPQSTPILNLPPLPP